MGRFVSAALVAAMLLAGSAAQAINLVSNPDFDEGTDPWAENETFIALDYDALDVDGDSESGSALVTITGTQINEDRGGIFQCVRVRGDRDHELGGSIYIPGGQPGEAFGNEARLVAVWYGSDDCSGNSMGSDRTVLVGDVDMWVSVLKSGITSPASAGSARVIAELEEAQAAAMLRAHFDAILFVPEPGSHCLRLAALAAVAALTNGRRRWPRAPSRASPSRA